MNSWINKYNNILTLIVALLALGLSCVSFVKSCSNENYMKETNYTLSSIEYRPRLKLSNPQIHSLVLFADSVPFKQSNDISDSIIDVEAKISMKVNFRITNIGSSTAKIVGWAIADTLSNDPFIKTFIKDNYRKQIDTYNNLKFPHKYEEITPFDSCIIELDYSPQFIVDNKLIIHILVFYENENEQLFDTYYWINVKTNEVILPNPLFFRNNPEKLKKIQSKMLKIIDINDENNYSSIYSKEQKKEMIEYLQ